MRWIHWRHQWKGEEAAPQLDEVREASECRPRAQCPRHDYHQVVYSKGTVRVHERKKVDTRFCFRDPGGDQEIYKYIYISICIYIVSILRSIYTHIPDKNPNQLRVRVGCFLFRHRGVLRRRFVSYFFGVLLLYPTIIICSSLFKWRLRTRTRNKSLLVGI